MNWWRKADWLTRSGLVVLAVLVLASVIGTLFGIGGRPDAIAGPRLAPPGGAFPLGTDQLGRSLLPRLFEGIGTTLLLSTVAVLVTAVLATALGLVAAIPAVIIYNHFARVTKGYLELVSRASGASARLLSRDLDRTHGGAHSRAAE